MSMYASSPSLAWRTERSPFIFHKGAVLFRLCCVRGSLVVALLDLFANLFKLPSLLSESSLSLRSVPETSALNFSI